MRSRTPARTPARRLPVVTVAGLLVVIATLAVAIGARWLASSSATGEVPSYVLPSGQAGPQQPPQPAVAEAAAPTDVPRSATPRPEQPPQPAEAEVAAPTDGPRGDQPRLQRPPRQAVAEPAIPADVPRREHHDASGVADGAVPDSTTVFDAELPGVANLDPELLGALREAATAAAADGVTFIVTSGWRSPAYQNQLLREAISTYGSEAEAARWVATADTSPHVSGQAVDLGPVDATAWLSEHGTAYGLCQIYRNEPWHYELRPPAIDHGCPPMYADPTHDPRMRP